MGELTIELIQLKLKLYKINYTLLTNTSYFALFLAALLAF